MIREIHDYVITELATDRELRTLAVEDDLIASGILDSMGIVKLIQFIEDRYGIQVEDDEVIPENFQHLAAIEAFIRRKTAASAG